MRIVFTDEYISFMVGVAYICIIALISFFIALAELTFFGVI